MIPPGVPLPGAFKPGMFMPGHEQMGPAGMHFPPPPGFPPYMHFPQNHPAFLAAHQNAMMLGPGHMMGGPPGQLPPGAGGRLPDGMMMGLPPPPVSTYMDNEHNQPRPPVCALCQKEFLVMSDQQPQIVVCSSGCHQSFHTSCVGLSAGAVRLLQNEPLAEWACSACYLHTVPPLKVKLS